MEILLALLGGALALATLLPVLRHQAWWVRVFDFPRLQISAGLLAVLVVHTMSVPPGRGAWFARSLLLLCLVVQFMRMVPYTRLARRQVQDTMQSPPRHAIRLLFANVLQTNRDAQALLQRVRRADPDVFLALETDAWWAGALDGLAATHPYGMRLPQDNTYGMLLFSRYELVEPRVQFLVQDDVPSIHTRVRLPGGPLVDLYCLHPRPPAPGEADSSGPRDAELLIVGRAIKKSPGPAIVMGDMNDVAWSHTSRLFREISGLLDPRIGRGFFNTFHAGHRLIRYPLDHFFHTNDFRLVSFRRLGAFGSDHFPVFIHLNHEPDAQAAQPEPEADAGQHEEAAGKIAGKRRTDSAVSARLPGRPARPGSRRRAPGRRSA